MKNQRGITLIVLIITVILMLILAAVVLNAIIGENGLIKLSIGTAKKSNEEAAKEKLQIALEELRTHKYVDEEYNDEYIDNYLKSKGMTVNSNIVIVDGIAFEIDRENLVILSRKQAYVTIKSEIKERLGNGIVNMLVKIESDTQIDIITFPNEDETTLELTTDKLTLAKDLKVELNKEYIVTVKTKDGKVTTKTILLEGDGTKEHPIIIRTKEELQAVNEDLSAYYKLGVNIDLTDFEFTPIGSQAAPFTGNIDGTGYTISNLKLDNEESDNIGLFGYNNGTISHITLNDITVKGKSNVGGLVGYNTGTVTNCKVSGNVTGLGDNVGGLIGYVYAVNKSVTLSGNGAEGKVVGVNQVGGLIGQVYTYATSGTTNIYIQKSYSTGDVEGKQNIGGLIGYQKGEINSSDVNGRGAVVNNYVQESYAIGNVKGETNIGGLVGYAYAYSYYNSDWNGADGQTHVRIQNSFETGKVEGKTNVGGLVGNVYRNGTGGRYKTGKAYPQITNVYAIGEVTATETVGGLVGTTSSSGNGSTTVTNSYWTPETTKQENSVLGTKNIIPYMMRKVGYDNWNFETIWEIDELNTIAYLKNIPKPDSVNKRNITYEEFDVVGEGTKESPFIITHPLQLQKITDRLSSYYKLGVNIDLTGREWIPIGTSAAPFTGNIDGTGYTITNLTYDNESGENVGLFGYNSGTVSNITLENITVKGKTNVGGLVGYNKGTVTQSKVKGNVIGTGDNVGILIGYNNGIVKNNQTEGVVTNTGNNTGGLIGQTVTGISNNISKTEVHGQDNVGGLIGYAYATNKSITLSGNGAEGKVVGVNQVGGLIGQVYTYATSGTTNIYIQKSYSTGDVEGKQNIGGLIGYQKGEINSSDVNGRGAVVNNYVQESYAIGNVKGETNIGGLVGYAYAYSYYNSDWNGADGQTHVRIQNSFETGKVEGKTNVGGLVGNVYRNGTGGRYKTGKAYPQITNVYAIGEVTATETVGGLVGTTSSSGNGSTIVTDSFWNTETTKQETSVLGTAANTTSMMGTELYTNWSSDVWTMEQGQYPKLKF